MRENSHEAQPICFLQFEFSIHFEMEYVIHLVNSWRLKNVFFRMILADLFWPIYTFRNHVLIRLMNFRKLHFDPIFPQLSKTCFQNEEDIIFTATYACSKKIRFRNSFPKKSIIGYANSANHYQTISQTFYRFPLKIK